MARFFYLKCIFSLRVDYNQFFLFSLLVSFVLKDITAQNRYTILKKNQCFKRSFLSNLHFINMQNGNLVLLYGGEVDDNVNEIPNEICSVKNESYRRVGQLHSKI